MFGPGIIRKLDDLGRIVIPKEIRKRHEINDKDFVTIIDAGSHVIVKNIEMVAYSVVVNKILVNIKIYMYAGCVENP